MTTPVTTSSVRVLAVSVLLAVLLYASGFLVLLTPLPLVYDYVRWGQRTGIYAAAASFLVMAVIYIVVMPALPEPSNGSVLLISLPGIGLLQMFSRGSVQMFGLSYFIFYVVLAMAIGEGARREWSFSRWAGVAVAAGCGGILVLTLLVQVIADVSVAAGIRAYLDAVMTELVKLNTQSGLSGAQMQYLSSNKESIVSLVFGLIPSLVFVFVLAVVALNLLVGRRLARVPRAVTRMRQAITFRLPDNAVWIVIGCGLAFFVDQYVLHTGLLKIVAINGLVAMGAVFFFQGFAVAAFFIERIRMRFARLLLYITIVVFFQTVGLVLVGLGVADVWIHFRQRLRTPSGIKG